MNADSEANRKLADKNRLRIFKWRCLFPQCRGRGRLNYKIPNNQSALRHAENYRDHNVAVIRWEADGEVFIEVFQFKSKPDYDGKPLF